MVFDGKIFIAADPAGEKLKDHVANYLKTVRNLDVTVTPGADKYWVVGADVAKNVIASGDGRIAGEIDKKEKARGILFCGTGCGVGITANKVPGIHAVTAENERGARCSRAINDSNVLCMGGFFTSESEAEKIVDGWREQEFNTAPVSGDYKPEWWSKEAEEFLDGQWPDVHRIQASCVPTAEATNGKVGIVSDSNTEIAGV